MAKDKKGGDNPKPNRELGAALQACPSCGKPIPRSYPECGKCKEKKDKK